MVFYLLPLFESFWETSQSCAHSSYGWSTMHTPHCIQKGFTPESCSVGWEQVFSRHRKIQSLSRMYWRTLFHVCKRRRKANVLGTKWQLKKKINREVATEARLRHFCHDMCCWSHQNVVVMVWLCPSWGEAVSIMTFWTLQNHEPSQIPQRVYLNQKQWVKQQFKNIFSSPHFKTKE